MVELAGDAGSSGTHGLASHPPAKKSFKCPILWEGGEMGKIDNN